MRDQAQRAIFNCLKRLGGTPFTFADLASRVVAISGEGAAKVVKDDIRWYLDQGWLEAVGERKTDTPGRNPTLYSFKASRDIGKVRYRNQCAKKWLTR